MLHSGMQSLVLEGGYFLVKKKILKIIFYVPENNLPV